MPQAAASFSPYWHAIELPRETFADTPVLLLLLLTLIAATIGILGFRRRVINTS